MSDPLQIFGPKTCGYCGQIHPSGFDCREARLSLTTIRRAEPHKLFSVIMHPASGLSDGDLAHLSARADEEIEGSGSTHCAVSKVALRRLIHACRELLVASRPGWRVGDRVRVVVDNEYGDGAADIGTEFVVEGLREGSGGRMVLLTATATRGFDGFYAERCELLPADTDLPGPQGTEAALSATDSPLNPSETNHG